MSPEQAELVDRIRDLLIDERTVREVPMFGGRAFMVDDQLVVSAQKDGGLLVRVDPARHAELLARPGAWPAEMGAGRTMGPGWIAVAANVVAGHTALASWVGLALEHHRATGRPGDVPKRYGSPGHGTSPGAI